MAYYDALVNKWATLAPGTTAQKLAAINALTVSGAAQRMIIPSYEIYNCINVGEFTSATAANQTLVRDLLNMGMVDASPGAPARTRMTAIFAAGSATRTALNALVAQYDTPALPWWQANVAQGGGGLTSPVSLQDLAAAGGLT